MKHWWDRTKREQKHIRRWAREPLATNLQLQAKARAAKEEERAARRRAERQACTRCRGRGQVVARRLHDGVFITIPCPGCRPEALSDG